jgi:hypothetical protein
MCSTTMRRKVQREALSHGRALRDHQPRRHQCRRGLDVAGASQAHKEGPPVSDETARQVHTSPYVGKLA